MRSGYILLILAFQNLMSTLKETDETGYPIVTILLFKLDVTVEVILLTPLVQHQIRYALKHRLLCIIVFFFIL